MSRVLRKNQQGFTVPELLVVMVVLLGLCVGAYYVLKPADYGPQQRDAARRLAIARISDALIKYYGDHGQLPSAISTQKKIISTDKKAGIDICPDLVPRYLKDLPLDPSLNVKTVKGTCATKNQQYTSSFLVNRSSDGQAFTISAPLHEGNDTIAITRHLDSIAQN